jgi:predicted PurR-regulated permease PerM
LATGLGRLLGSTPQLILFLFLSWMSWVYFLAEGKEHRASLLPRLIPWPRQRHLLGHTLGEVLRQMVLASLALAIVQSLLVTISLGLAGIPKFLLWGAIAFFLSFVPVVGTFPVMGISALYAYLQGQSLAAVLLLVAALAIGLCDNLLRPLLMRGSSEINFFWLFLSLLGGVSMFGLPGVILGPWFVTLFLAVHREAQKPQGTLRA